MKMRNDKQSPDSQESSMKLIHCLFGEATESNLDEKRIEEHITSMIKNFRSNIEVSTNISLEMISKRFLDSKIPDDPTDIEAYLHDLSDQIVADSINTSSAKYIGHMTSALPIFMPPLSRLMVTLNQNLVKVETSKVLTLCERQALAMIHRLFYDLPENVYSQHIQDPEVAFGTVTSGGTVGNILALWCARKKLRQKYISRSKNEKADSWLHNDSYISDEVLIGSEAMHFSIYKAADLLGLDQDNVIKVRVKSQGSIDVDELSRVISECINLKKRIVAVIGVAGATETGAIDELEKMADLAEMARTHFHVDAAWGGPIKFSEKYGYKLSGIERADTITVDGHKQLYLPLGIGFVLFRDIHLADVVKRTSEYIIRKGSMDLGRYTLEGSRPAMVLFLHAALRILGYKGYRYIIDQGIEKASYMSHRIEENEHFELITRPATNIVTYRYIPGNYKEKAKNRKLTQYDNREINHINVNLQKLQRGAGKNFVSRTKLFMTHYGKDTPIVVLRSVISNPLTKKEDIDQILTEQIHIGNSLEIRCC